MSKADRLGKKKQYEAKLMMQRKGKDILKVAHTEAERRSDIPINGDIKFMDAVPGATIIARELNGQRSYFVVLIVDGKVICLEYEEISHTHEYAVGGLFRALFDTVDPAEIFAQVTAERMRG